MNYIYYNGASIPFIKIVMYHFLKDDITMELEMESEQQVYELYLYLKENLNMGITIEKGSTFINFILTECYINKQNIILKGRN